MQHSTRRFAAIPVIRTALALAWFALLASAPAAFAADRGFPYDSIFRLEANPMKGSKRVPVLDIGARGEATVNLWCNIAQAQLVVVENTITIILNPQTQQQCEPERMQADENLIAALQQVTTWQRQDDLLVLSGEQQLRFRLSSN